MIRPGRQAGTGCRKKGRKDVKYAKSLRNGLTSAAIALGLCVTLAAHPALADFPERPITLVLGSTPGSAPDTLGRIVAERMANVLGQPVVVENRQGANGSIAATQVAQADPDGYSLMLMTAVHSITPTTRNDLEYDFVEDFRGVGMIASVPLLFVVNNDLNTPDMASFVERAKQGDIFYSAPGIGSIQQLATEEFSKRAGIQMTVVPYRGGGNATKAVIANEVQLFFAGIPPALPHVKSGALTALAISTPERSPAAPDVPTMIELGYDGLTADNWHAIYVRSDTPDEIVQVLLAKRRARGRADVRVTTTAGQAAACRPAPVRPRSALSEMPRTCIASRVRHPGPFCNSPRTS
jgi:tripartite-type tricarboxylate transporter receptor subunit TctC